MRQQKNRQFCCLLGFILLVLPLVSEQQRPHHHNSLLCNSIEISTRADFEALRHCRIVVGHVRITHLLATEDNSDVSTDVEEITDYLLVYRANSLRTLQHIFPNLVLIRGEELLFDKYAFVVYENRNLANLGLASLLRVQKGDIRVESNPQLCYVNTVNWVFLMQNVTQQHFSVKNNRPINYCPICDSTNVEKLIDVTTQHLHCWNRETFQRRAPAALSLSCAADCHPALGCAYENGLCCQRNCLTECLSNNCNLCASPHLQSKCFDNCIFPTFLINKRECIQNTTCRDRGYIPHAGVCMEKCPEHYLPLKDHKGVVNCVMPCNGSFVVHKIEDLAALKDCTGIRGSLTIELTTIKTKITDLENMLMNIREITGYLKITRSPQIVSLNFLRNLNTIKGEELIENKLFS